MILLFLSSSSIECGIIKNKLFVCCTYQQHHNIFFLNKKINIQEITIKIYMLLLPIALTKFGPTLRCKTCMKSPAFLVLSFSTPRLDFRSLDKLCTYKQNFIKKKRMHMNLTKHQLCHAIKTSTFYEEQKYNFFFSINKITFIDY